MIISLSHPNSLYTYRRINMKVFLRVYFAYAKYTPFVIHDVYNECCYVLRAGEGENIWHRLM